MSQQENEFKTAQYRSGFLAALKNVFDVLAEMHHPQAKFDRPEVDYIWDKIKEIENRAHNNIFTQPD